METATEYLDQKAQFQAWDETQALGEASMRSLILHGKICPYCGGTPVLAESYGIYHGVDHGLVWICRPCQAWVGCHRDENHAPLGRLADARLRSAKTEAVQAFAPIWGKWSGVRKNARHLAYKWLAGHMGISVSRSYIAKFDVDQCREVVDICRTRNAQFDFDQFLERNT